MKPKEIANALSSMVNNMNSEADELEFTEAITRDHRTLQQSMFKLFVRSIAAWAEMADKNMYDLRNEFTVKECKKLAKILEDDLVIVRMPDNKTRVITPYV